MMQSHGLAEFLATPRPKIKVETRVCRYCEQPFQRRPMSRSVRNWCYESACEIQREQEHSRQVSIAATIRRKKGL